MKYFTLTFLLNEKKVNEVLARKTTQSQKDTFKKLIPVIPLVYTATNKNGDKSEVDNWTRPIPGVKREVKREKGFIFYEAIFTLPNYANIKADLKAPLFIRKDEKSYEIEFEKFVRDYIYKQNSFLGCQFITGKFSGSISTIAAIIDSSKEKSDNYIVQPANQIKDKVEESGNFFKENKNLIIGVTTGISLLFLISFVRK